MHLLNKLATLSRIHTHYFALLVSAALIALAVIFAVVRLYHPADGARLWLRAQAPLTEIVVVAPLFEQSSALQANDHVVEIDGQSVQDWLDGVSRAGLGNQASNIGQTAVYTIVREGVLFQIPVLLRRFPLATIVWANLGFILLMLAFEAEAFWIWNQRKYEGATQALLVAASAFAAFTICWYLGMDVATFIGAQGLWVYFRVITFIMVMTASAAMLHFAILLPRMPAKRQIGPRLSFFIYMTPYPIYLLYVVLCYSPVKLLWLRQWEIGIQVLLCAYFLLALAAILSAHRSLRSGIMRRRVDVILFAFVLAAFLAIFFGLIPTFTARQLWLQWGAMPLLALPIAMGMAIAVVFYHLFDIRVILHRTMVWSALTGLVVLVYVVVVGGLSIVFQMRGSPIFALIATGLTAALFHPLKERLDRGVSALLYGERDTPYQVILRLTQRLDAALAPNDSLNQIVRTIGEGLKLPYAAIELLQGHHYVRAASWGEVTGNLIEYPLDHEHEIVGRLLVAPRSPGESLTPGDQQLLIGLLYHAEIALQTARLTADLQKSRESLVLAREEERRRLRRDLHDGLGPALASLALEIDAARNLLTRDPTRVDRLLVELKEQLHAAIADIRRLVYELRPASLDELGLIGALRECLQRFESDGALNIAIDMPESLPALSAATEVAAYRIVLEAVTNIVRHAHATSCQVSLKLDRELLIEVTDDGCGLPNMPRRGVGLSSMVERAAELGGHCMVERSHEGGTRLFARLPLQTS